MPHRAIRIFFALAGLYGVAVLVPMYFQAWASTPQAIFIYGFLGAALATQLAYLLIATNPVRYRPVMLVGVFSKFSFAIPCILLAMAGRLSQPLLPAAGIDLALAAGFILSWFWTGRLIH